MLLLHMWCWYGLVDFGSVVTASDLLRLGVAGGGGSGSRGAVGCDAEGFQLEPPGAVLRAAAAESGHERVAELPGHCAVEHEVDAVVEERHDVEDVAERPVHVLEEVLDKEVAEREDALGELCEQEEPDDGEQHGRRAVVLTRTVRLVLATLGLQLHAPLVRLCHCDDKEDGENG